MPIKKHTLDADGDLYLLLARHAKKAERSPTNGSSTKIPSTTLEVLHGLGRSDLDLDGDTVIENLGEISATEVNSEDSLRDSEEDKYGKDIEVNVLVSSKHMMLASPVFKAMLQRSNFREGCTLEFAGSVEVALPDDDPEAMLILLDVVHGRNRSVPRKVNLEVLSHIAILADKYQMVEAMEAFSDSWIEQLRPDLPKHNVEGGDGTPIFRWLAISWVFGKAKEFKAMTKLVERAGYEDIEISMVLNLPIPEIIIEAIRKRQQEALQKAYRLVSRIINRYQRNKIQCDRPSSIQFRPACDAMVLGSLIKSATALGLYPEPHAPYLQISFDKVASLLDQLAPEALCDEISRRFLGGECSKPAHGVKDSIKAKKQAIYERLSGLDLEDYKEIVPPMLAHQLDDDANKIHDVGDQM